MLKIQDLASLRSIFSQYANWWGSRTCCTLGLIWCSINRARPFITWEVRATILQSGWHVTHQAVNSTGRKKVSACCSFDAFVMLLSVESKHSLRISSVFGAPPPDSFCYYGMPRVHRGHRWMRMLSDCPRGSRGGPLYASQALAYNRSVVLFFLVLAVDTLKHSRQRGV